MCRALVNNGWRRTVIDRFIERDEDFTTINQSASFFNIGIGIEFLPRKHFLYMRLQVADWVYPIFHSPEL